ncbi:GPP34 family phosphoprotein [Streptomyces sp. JJ36]|uniref:GOLPH3/VPS74 family protein n=1 Tax=Streptomyces sp. JJ36 TaxID=2736645 RepID=UPI001F2F6E52|nr:GPP34 family phosphoprotein [Streptomyces sp. JJ36]MCF6525559.1 GPP34 family phosphoprotein [Streptomyces sp. JJ36]
MTHVTLGEELVLLSLDDDSGAGRDESSVAWAVAGAVLVELALAGRTEVRDDAVVVTDRSPVGVGYLDAELARLAEREEPPAVRKVLEQARKEAPEGATRTLVERGLVRDESRKVLGLFPVRRFPEAEGSVETEVRRRLDAVVRHGAEPDGRTAALVALLHGARLQRLAFGSADRRRVQERMKEIAEGQGVPAAVRKAVDHAQAVLTVVATTAATTGALAAEG